ncbi:MAG TPA: substrate-binding domain-containing protein, partial [Polyangiaceae bacterium]|nr:substrate-binding domain-containing protein [Polyangiaceae bacterium]
MIPPWLSDKTQRVHTWQPRLRAVRALLASCGAVALLSAGCGKREVGGNPIGGGGVPLGGGAAGISGAGMAPPAKAAARFLIGVSQSNLGEPYRVQMNADLAREAKAHPEIELIFKDAQNDSLRQRAQVEELVSQGIALLIISPKESAPLTAPVARVYDQGIPVIVLDRRVEGDRFTSFIGPDNRQIGQAAGKWVVATFGGKAKIVELEGLMTSSPARERHEGFWEGVERKRHPGVEAVFTADTQWLEPNARREMESALAAHSHIDLVFAHNDPGAHGAYLAAKAAGREQEMKFLGIDALPHEGVR